MSDFASGDSMRRDVVVIGASFGGVQALQRLAADLPADFPAALLAVLHIGANASLLPGLLAAAGPNSASHVKDGEPLRSGHFAVAPPDHHLLVARGHLRLSRGPKENFARPAIDPLFRSAALAYGPRVIGVVLTGNLDDGTAGLMAIERCGGLALVQDPVTAVAPSMPASALAYVAVSHRLPLEEIGGQLTRLVGQPTPPAIAVPSDLLHEQASVEGRVNAMEDLKAIATPSPLVCPECGGGLWEVNDALPPRFRCHTGHAYTLRSLEFAMSASTEGSLWESIRALQERAAILRRGVTEDRRLGECAAASERAARAERDEKQAGDLRSLIDKLDD